MNTLVIGYGSSGKRHAQILRQLGCQVSLVSAQLIDQYPRFATIQEALSANPDINLVIIANPTHQHLDSLCELIACNYTGTVLVEKPLYANEAQLPQHNIAKILLAYNLRFHSLLKTLHEIAKTSKLISCSAYVGQYLPSWRSDQTYQQSYSAQKKLGGGVLRDLSHEIDYLIWLCGPVKAVTGLGGQLSNLEISSDDVFSVLMATNTCPVVSFHLNYLDKYTRRILVLNTHDHTYTLDFIKGKLLKDHELIASTENGVMDTYIAQLQALLTGNTQNFCNYDEGLSTVRLINTIERANQQKQWITL